MSDFIKMVHSVPRYFEDLGNGAYAEVVAFRPTSESGALASTTPGAAVTQVIWEDAGFSLNADGNLKSETQVNASTGATRTRTWMYATDASGNVSATAGAWT